MLKDAIVGKDLTWDISGCNERRHPWIEDLVGPETCNQALPGPQRGIDEAAHDGCFNTIQPAGSLPTVIGTQHGMEKVDEYHWDGVGCGVVLLAHSQC